MFIHHFKDVIKIFPVVAQPGHLILTAQFPSFFHPIVERADWNSMNNRCYQG